MTTPRDVFAALSDGISEGRFGDLSALYAEDTVVEHPQAVPRPGRITGRVAVHERFTGALAAAVRLKRKNVVVHETTDPEVIVAEYDYDAESVETGKTTPTANIQVLRVRDGLIVHSRDYHDYLRLAAIRDGVDQLAAAYEQAPPRELSPIGPRTSSDPKSRRGVFERLVYGLRQARRGAGGAVRRGNARTHPFQPGSAVVRTREELRAHFKQAAGLGVDLEATDLVTYKGTDPEVLIAERSPTRASTAAAGPHREHLRDADPRRPRHRLQGYGDHLGIAGDTGKIPELAAKL